jgi:hypothetical protein
MIHKYNNTQSNKIINHPIHEQNIHDKIIVLLTSKLLQLITTIIVLIYVDDIIIIENNENFDIKDLRKLKYLLGIEIHTQKRKFAFISNSTKKYIWKKVSH